MCNSPAIPKSYNYVIKPGSIPSKDKSLKNDIKHRLFSYRGNIQVHITLIKHTIISLVFL